MKSQVITPWTTKQVNDLGLVNCPKLKIDHPSLWTVVDMTGQPSENLSPDPNMYVVEATGAESTFDAIEADPNYHIQWSEA